jgi:hypothetical protein
MKRSVTSLALILFGVLCGFSGAMFASHKVEAQARPEYLVESIPFSGHTYKELLPALLNKRSQEGWTFHSSVNESILIFTK